MAKPAAIELDVSMPLLGQDSCHGIDQALLACLVTANTIFGMSTLNGLMMPCWHGHALAQVRLPTLDQLMMPC